MNYFNRILAVFAGCLILLIVSCENDDEADQQDPTQSGNTNLSQQAESTAETNNANNRQEVEQEAEQLPTQDLPDGTVLDFEEVLILHLLDHEESVVIHNTQEWEQYLERANQYFFVFDPDNPDFNPDEPPCDLSQSILVVHSLGLHDGCPYASKGVTNVVVQNGEIRVFIGIDSRFIPMPTPPIHDCAVQDVNDGIAVSFEQSDMPVSVTVNYY